MFDLLSHPHRRYNPLSREWVLVSPHRTERPWQGQVEQTPPEVRPQYDPKCYLCPGNSRAGGVTNPKYSHTFVFTNDFAALLPDTPAGSMDEGGLLQAEAECGTCRVVCFSPRHDLTLSEMDNDDIALVVDTWADQYEELAKTSSVNYVQIFENRGAMMGASNPHPHGQIWATEHLPLLVEREAGAQLEYYEKHGKTLLADYISLELQEKSRVVCENDHFLVVVPFWAVWPFETLVVCKRPAGAVSDLNSHERIALADILRRVTTRYDNLFNVSFPYSMGFHQRPTDGKPHPDWHLHAHFYPPLLRSATVRKFMVGYEMLAEPQRDITAESAAERLRALPEEHFRGPTPTA